MLISQFTRCTCEKYDLRKSGPSPAWSQKNLRPTPPSRYYKFKRFQTVSSRHRLQMRQSSSVPQQQQENDMTDQTPIAPIVETRAQVAQSLGISLSTFDGYLAMGCPGTRGNYSLVAIEAWRESRRRKPLTVEDQRAAAVEELRSYLAVADRIPANVSARLERRWGAYNLQLFAAEARKLIANQEGTTDG